MLFEFQGFKQLVNISTPSLKKYISEENVYSVSTYTYYHRWIWVKVFKNGPSKICGRQPLKILK